MRLQISNFIFPWAFTHVLATCHSQEYQKEFPDIPIGYSGHETGIAVSLAAVAMGAKVLERHFTLDKRQKGNDHAASLEPDEFKQMVDSIRDIEEAMGKGLKRILPCEEPFIKKVRFPSSTSKYTVIWDKCDVHSSLFFSFSWVSQL